MTLPYDLISQFAKITKNEKEAKKETTAYGTVVSYDDVNYVKLDGSDLLTPVSTTVDAKSGDRVTVLLKNHTATVTGNLTAPAARNESVTIVADNITNFEKIFAKLVTTEALEAESARIDKLEAYDVTVKNTLTANDASIKTLTANNVTINERLTAQKALIDDLQATTITAEEVKTTYATITSLNAANAHITRLDSNVADIDTLLFGSAGGTTIQTSFSNSVIAQLGNAQIKSAMIESVSASKITAGDIITNNVRVKSEDGLLLISDETMQISDGTRVRVQIGKDAANDYSINIWDQNGDLMFSKGGITDSAIKDAIIRNDMVSDTANISAHKLDIDSLFDEINDSTNTIKSTKVYLDDKKQTLDVAFNSLSSTVTDQGETITSQGTAISTIQGQISSKIWQQDIDTAKNTMSTQYSTLEQKLDGVAATVASHTTQIGKKADSTTVTTVSNKVTALETNLSGFKSTVGETYATKTSLDSLEIGGRNLVAGTSDTWANITVPRYAAIITGRKHCSEYGLQAGDRFTFALELNPIEKTGLRARLDFYSGVSGEEGKVAVFGNTITNGAPGKSYLTTTVPEGCEYITLMIGNSNADDETTSSVEQYRKIKMEKGDRSTDWTRAPEDVESDVTTLEDRISAAETAISQNATAITLAATKTDIATAKTEAITSANANTATLLNDYSTTAEMNSAIELKANSITSAVSSTYATKSELSTTNTNVSKAQNAANAAQNTVDNLEIGGRNLLTNSLIVRTELLNGGEYTYSKTSKGQEALFSSLNLEPGQYMYSLYMKRTEGVDVARIRLHKNGVTTGYFTADETDGEWHRVRIPITVTSSEDTYGSQVYNHNFGDEFDSTVVVKKLKIERGNKATDWTPAPEDIDAEITDLDARMTSAESSITQLSNKITANVTETTNLGTRMSTVEQTASGLTTRLTSAETNISKAQTSATNAAKTATNYLKFSSSGLLVGDMTASTLGKNVLINSDGVNIRNGSTVMASFEANKITLGQNAEDSVIDLCNGAGKISANTAEAATSYPNRNAILFESQELEFESVRHVINVSNAYGASSTPSIKRRSELYMTRSTSTSSESCARLCAEHTTTSSGAYTKSGFSAMTYDAASTTRAMVYAYDSANSKNNQLNVYPTKTTMNKPLFINSVEFTGKNKVLWTGGYYMSDSQTATLSAAISAQTNGVVLVWSYYVDGANDNSNFQCIFIPKHFITLHNGKGIGMVLTNGSMNVMASKYVYVSDTSIKGYAGNDDAATAKDTGVTSTPKNFVLRYVIGV